MVASLLTSIEIQQNVLTLFEEEYTHQDIVKRVGISRRTVDRIPKNGHVKQKNEYTKRNVRPRKLCRIKEKEIRGIVKRNSRLTTKQIIRDIGENISQTTITRVLKKKGLLEER